MLEKFSSSFGIFSSFQKAAEANVHEVTIG